jgi:hypothetical protein
MLAFTAASVNTVRRPVSRLTMPGQTFTLSEYLFDVVELASEG